MKGYQQNSSIKPTFRKKKKISELILVLTTGGGDLDKAKVFQNRDTAMNPLSEPVKLHP